MDTYEGTEWALRGKTKYGAIFDSHQPWQELIPAVGRGKFCPPPPAAISARQPFKPLATEKEKEGAEAESYPLDYILKAFVFVWD